LRYRGLLLAAVLLGCAHPGTKFERRDDVDFSRYRRIGVAPFTDSRGQGRRIAEGINRGLPRLMYEPADMKALEKILAEHKPDRELGLSLEALVLIRSQTSADALIFGSMAPDWSAAKVSLVETEMGDQILRAIVKPGGKNQKIFSGPDEVVRETLRVFAKLDR